MEFSDPFSIHNLDLTASVTPGDRLPADQRWHVAAGYRHYGAWGRSSATTPPPSTTSSAPPRSSRKGYGLEPHLRPARCVRDAPRTLDLAAGVDGYAGLERLPDYQNVSTSPGLRQDGRGERGARRTGTPRSSLGSVDTEKGHSWRLDGLPEHACASSGWVTPPGAGSRCSPGTLDLGVPLPVGHSSVWLRNAAGYSPGDPERALRQLLLRRLRQQPGGLPGCRSATASTRASPASS